VFLAEDPPAAGGSSIYTILMFVALGLVFYFLLIRPQSKRRRETAAMQSKLGIGDEVQTVGGLFGTVTDVDNEAVTVEAAPGVELRFAVGAIARVITRAETEETEEAEEADDEDEDSPDNADARKTIESG
jgi:preprotein translocase subunit YajC